MFRPRISLRWFLLGTAGFSALIGIVIKPAYDDWQGRRWLAHQQWIRDEIDGNGNGVVMRNGHVVEAYLGRRTGRKAFSLLREATELEMLVTSFPLDDKDIHELTSHRKLRAICVNAPSPELTNDSFKVLSQLPELTGVVIGHTRVDDEGISELCELENLGGFHIAYSPVRGFGFAKLKSAPRLVSLFLHGSAIDDDGLSGLVRCKKLFSLELGMTSVHGAGLVHLQGLQELHKLGLAKTRLTSGEAFGSLDQVVELDLSETQLSPGVLRHLAGMDNLLRLNLTRSAIADDSLVELEDVRQVKWLDLSHTKITDAGLAHLRKHRQLVSLILTGTRVSEAELEKLHVEMPAMDIRHDGKDLRGDPKLKFEAMQPRQRGKHELSPATK